MTSTSTNSSPDPGDYDDDKFNAWYLLNTFESLRQYVVRMERETEKAKRHAQYEIDRLIREKEFLAQDVEMLRKEVTRLGGNPDWPGGW